MRPLLNIDYNGFLSRDFFQVVVSVDMTKDDLPINGLRSNCKKEAYRKKDQITIELAKDLIEKKKISDKKFLTQGKKTESMLTSTSSSNVPALQSPEPEATTTTEKKTEPSEKIIASELFDKNNYQLSRGEFGWLLERMFLFREDYSHPERCIFVFRAIEKDLYQKLENTKMIIEGNP